MKVIIRCVNNRVTKTEMEQIIESLFQENKDLRVHIGHLRDELNLAQQQSEARRQVICERDKLIQELDEKLENTRVSAEIQRSLREEIAEKIGSLEKELAKSESDSSQGMSAMIKFWEEAVTEKNKTEERAEEYRIALMESDARVDECEKRMDWLSKEVLEWKATAKGYKNQYEELKAQKEADDKKCEEVCAACNERYEEVLAERNRLREEVARLTDERNTAVHENTEMMFDINELQDKWEAEHNLRVEAEKERDMYRSSAEAWHIEHDKVVAFADKRKEKLDEAMRTITCLNNDIHELEKTIDGINEEKRAYGEEIDRLRKVVTNLQSTRFTTEEFLRMIAREFMPSTGKGFADSVDF